MVLKNDKQTWKKRLVWIFLPAVLFLTLLALVITREGERTDTGQLNHFSCTGSVLNLASLSLPFVPNQGQWSEQVKFRADLFSGAFFVTDNRLVYALIKRANESGQENFEAELPSPSDRNLQIAVFSEKLLSRDGRVLELFPSGLKEASTRVSYFIGKNQEGRFSQIPAYEEVSLGEVYPGLEVRLRASSANVEKIFYFNPGTSVEEIRVKVEGINRLQLAEDGSLELVSEGGSLELMKPVGFQEIDGRRDYVEVAYEIKRPDEYGFKVLGSYHPGYPLVVDPALKTLSASTFIGGTGNDRGFCVAVDQSGSIYVAGYTVSLFLSDFPTKEGAYDRTANGGYDLFISKLNNTMTELLASTYLGGKKDEYVYSMVLGEGGHVYLTGITSSNDFPTTPDAYQRTYQGGDYDAFIVKMSSDLSAILASTYYGGSGLDYSAALTPELNSGHLLITGMTDSADFPLTPGAYSTSLKGGHDAFVARLSNSLNTLYASTLIGGSDYDLGSGIALDQFGYVLVAGRTRSADFPVTTGSYDTTYNGDYDGFVLRLAPELNALYNSTYIGGSGPDYLYALAVDAQQKIIVAGYTLSENYPVTEGAFSTSKKVGYEVFISKLNSSLSILEASTFFGGSGDDRLRSMIVDSSRNVYLTGWTKSANLPTTIGAFDRSYNGNWDVFVAKFSPNLGVLFASTYIGGTADDLGYGITLDSAGNVYVTGYTQSTAFPIADPDKAYDKSISGTDVFVASFAGAEQRLLTVTIAGHGSGYVVSEDGGINLGDNSEYYDQDIQIKLTAVPSENSVFAGWTGDVTSPDNPLTVTMDSNKNLTAKFVPAEDIYTLTVLKSGPGNGTVTSEDEQINCGEVCSVSYPAGTVVKLTATPDENSGFDSWSGDVYGRGKTITFVMDGDKTVVAVFGPTPLPDLTGEWQSLKISRFLGKTTVLTAFLKLINEGEAQCPGGYKIAFYLSADGSSLDTLLGTRDIGYNLAADSSRLIVYTQYLSSSLTLPGKYLIAVIDTEDKIEEKDETNNRVVFGPIANNTSAQTPGNENLSAVRKLTELKNKTEVK